MTKTDHAAKLAADTDKAVSAGYRAYMDTRLNTFKRIERTAALATEFSEQALDAAADQWAAARDRNQGVEFGDVRSRAHSGGTAKLLQMAADLRRGFPRPRRSRRS